MATTEQTVIACDLTAVIVGDTRLGTQLARMRLAPTSLDFDDWCPVELDHGGLRGGARVLMAPGPGQVRFGGPVEYRGADYTVEWLTEAEVTNGWAHSTFIVRDEHGDLVPRSRAIYRHLAAAVADGFATWEHEHPHDAAQARTVALEAWLESVVRVVHQHVEYALVSARTAAAMAAELSVAVEARQLLRKLLADGTPPWEAAEAAELLSEEAS